MSEDVCSCQTNLRYAISICVFMGPPPARSLETTLPGRTSSAEALEGGARGGNGRFPLRKSDGVALPRRRWSPCAGEDLNLHGPNGPQGPQPCASTNSATSARGRSVATARGKKSAGAL